MCGRFVSSSPPQRIAEHFGADLETEPLRESYNVAPTNDVYGVVADADGHRAVQSFRWGLLPSWAKEASVGSRMINARSETAAEKPAFRSSFARRRCIVPMDGFYEWTAGGPGGPLTKAGKPAKRPFFIRRTDGEPLAVAAIWTAWHDPQADDDAPWLHTVAVLTTGANATMAPLHDRMPAILPRAVWGAWLDPTNHNTGMLSGLLVPARDDLLEVHEVSTAVNNVRNKGVELIAGV